MQQSNDIGAAAEEMAVVYLQRLGWTILGRNWSWKHLGELDIIADDGCDVVIVEVRYRTSARYGLPEATIGPAKVRRLRRTAAMWRAMHGPTDRSYRFDVIAIDVADGQDAVRHYRNCW